MFNGILIFIITYFLIPLKWILRQNNNRKSKVDISGLRKDGCNVIVLTGGTGGLGYNVLKRLLQLKVHVIVGCRNSETIREIISELEEDEIEGSIDIYNLDLESLDSVRSFCNKVLGSGLPINGLINAAAVMGIPFKLTSDGNETQFQVNYLSHFLLANLLLPRIIESSTEDKPGFIINVSSITFNYGKSNFDNMNNSKYYNKWQAHYNSKLFQVLFSHYLGIKLKQRKVNVRVNSIHPGFMHTNLWNNYPCKIGIVKKLWGSLLGDPANGADDIIYIAFHAETSEYTGEFFMDAKIKRNIPKTSWTKMEQLWDVSCKFVKIRNIFEENSDNMNASLQLQKHFKEKTHSFIDNLSLPITNSSTLVSSNSIEIQSIVVTPLKLESSTSIVLGSSTSIIPI